MGIRFRCHLCGADLHVKDQLGGKRGRCPVCAGSFRVPCRDTEFSLRPDDRSQIQLNEPEEERSQAEPKPRVARKGTKKELAENDKAVAAGEQAGASDETSSSPGSAGQVLPDTLPLHPSEQKVQQQRAPSSALPPVSAPPLISDSPTSNWYVRPASGGQYGPVTGVVLWQWVLENRVGPDSLVWREDWKEWRTAAAVFHHRSTNEGPQPPAPPRTQSSLQPAGDDSLWQSTIPPTLGRFPQAPDPAMGTPVPSLGQLNRESRKKQKRRNYLIMVVSLVIIFLVLLVGLIVVLWRQYA